MQKNLRENRKYLRRRARRRKRIIIFFIFLMILAMCAFIVLRAQISLPYATVDLSTLARIEISGFDRDGIATVDGDEDKIDSLLKEVRSSYEDQMFHVHELDDTDFAAFRQSLSFMTPNGNGLSNGQTIKIIASYDEELAKKLKIDVTAQSCEVTVEGLQELKRVSVDEVFADLDVDVSGISPEISVSVENKSSHPFIKKLRFAIVDPKEFYSEGDTVSVRAYFDENLCRATGYTVDVPADECVKDYSVSVGERYISSASELPPGIVAKAVDAGLNAFRDANEYGVRVFCEANLVPVYINRKATFVYDSYSFDSAYFKTVFPEKRGELGLSYNDLDILYDVIISQADGTTCTAKAAVRFSNLVLDDDGSCSYDFSNPTIFSMSYFGARVKKNVVDEYKSTHDIEKVGL